MKANAQWRYACLRAWERRIREHYADEARAITKRAMDEAAQICFSEFADNPDMATLDKYGLAGLPTSITVQLWSDKTRSWSEWFNLKMFDDDWSKPDHPETWRHPKANHPVPSNKLHPSLCFGGSNPLPEWAADLGRIRNTIQAETDFADSECHDARRFKRTSQIVRLYPFVGDDAVPFVPQVGSEATA